MNSFMRKFFHKKKKTLISPYVKNKRAFQILLCTSPFYGSGDMLTKFNEVLC